MAKFEVVACPNCKQKLGLQNYVALGTQVVCANAKCGTSLKIIGRAPLRVEVVPEEATYSVEYRPESYG